MPSNLRPGSTDPSSLAEAVFGPLPRTDGQRERQRPALMHEVARLGLVDDRISLRLAAPWLFVRHASKHYLVALPHP